jgi:hypothetical protein
MKNKILILCLMAFLRYTADAQVVPGYMGLKFSVQYQLGVNPQWNNTSYSYLPYLSHNIQVGYVVSRKHEIGLQYTRIDYSSGIGATQGTSDGSSSVSADYRNFTGNNLTAYIKFFRSKKGFIAPLGRYFILGLSYENSKDKYHVTSDPNSAIGAPNYTTVRSHDLAIMMGVGRNIIVANRMLITIEGDVNLPVSTAIRAGLNGGYTAQLSGAASSSLAPYKYFNALDVMLVNILQIKIGIGVLAF